MDQQIINRKLESLRRCINRIESKRPERAAELEIRYQLLVIRCLVSYKHTILANNLFED
jgi:hypothetical protein